MMHVLYIHENFPAQFGHIAEFLTQHHGFRCTFVTHREMTYNGTIEVIPYTLKGGATDRSHYCSRTFENQTWHMDGVYRALRARPDIQPDLIVGHSGLGPTLWLRELYNCPIVCFFEYFYHVQGSDLDYRPDFPSTEENRLRARNRNAALMLDLENCTLGYSPTNWQRGCFPSRYGDKLRTIFDGIDPQIWRPRPVSPRSVGGLSFPDGTLILSYATRGMESMRGFDIFMKLAKRLMDRFPNLVVLIAGQDRAAYGNDERITGQKSFKDWTLAQADFDLTRLHFLGLLPREDLATLFTITNLHIYLTVPFVLSWSLLNALACGATVLASATAPVREVIQHGVNGLLCDFFDIETMTEQAAEVLENPSKFQHLGPAGIALISERYSMEVCLPQMLTLYQDALNITQTQLASKSSR